MLLKELTLRGLLSFGPDSGPIAMQPLNVLIGPNGSGKSNVIEAIDLLRSAATKLTAPMRGPGSSHVSEWLWKGSPEPKAEIKAIINVLDGAGPAGHRLEFAERQGRFELLGEAIGEERLREPVGDQLEGYSYLFANGRPRIVVPGVGVRELDWKDVALDESILSQRKDPDQYPVLDVVADAYRQVRIYREWSFGRGSIFRSPQSADFPHDRLEEDFSNLGLFLNHLRSIPKAKQAVLIGLRDLYEGLDDFDVRVKGGTVEVFLTEGDFITPASRLSDGTMRYLCLLAILCDPNPPGLICIEEPELGLHPDVIHKIADLLIEASERTQLIVTTHSDLLVDAMSECPEAVVVVEKHEGKTQFRRLAASDEMKAWLEKYRLGKLWISGELGGTRW